MRAPICAWYGQWYETPEDPPRSPEQPARPGRDRGAPERRDEPAPRPPPAPPRRPGARHALVIGRFLPPHAGHEYLIDTARGLADTVTVLVRTAPADPIDGALRLAWMRELCGPRVAALAGAAPAAGPDAPAFWAAWRDRAGAALAALPPAPAVDLLVSSDREAWRLAELLGAGHALVDPDRAVVPVSGTAIRRAPLAAWRYLPAPVRAHYARRVALIGPEGSGKSTLARELAQALGTVHVPEQARLFAARAGGALRERDLPAIAALQTASIAAAARRAERYVIADTDALAVALWGERLFGRAPAGAVAEAGAAPDLYLVTSAELPAPSPDGAAARAAFAARCLAAARASGARVVELPTAAAARRELALAAIAEL